MLGQSQPSPFLVTISCPSAVVLSLAEPQGTQACQQQAQSSAPSLFLRGFLGSKQLRSHTLKLAKTRFTDDSATLTLSPCVYALYH